MNVTSVEPVRLITLSGQLQRLGVVSPLQDAMRQSSSGAKRHGSLASSR